MFFRFIAAAGLLLTSLALAQVRDNGSRVIEGTINHCTDAGASDAYACNLSPAIAAYVNNACYQFKAATANTGAASINFNSLGAITIKKVAGGVTTDLSDNDIRANQIVRVCYDGTNMQMQSQLGNAAAGGGGVASVSGTANKVTVGGTASDPVLTIADNLDLTTHTSTKPVKAGTSAPGTCAVGELFFDTDATAGQNLLVCSATNIWTAQGGGGGGGGSINTAANPKMIWWVSSGGGGLQVTGAANQGTCHRVNLEQAVVSASISFEVTTGSGTGCSGGTCGFIAGVFDSAGDRIAVSEVGYSGHATDAKNINTTGQKKLAWASGSAVSGGNLTAPAGSNSVCYSTDSTALQIRGIGSAYWMVQDVALVANSHGGQSSFGSGNGASITIPTTKTGTWTLGWADWTPLMWWN